VLPGRVGVTIVPILATPELGVMAVMTSEKLDDRGSVVTTMHKPKIEHIITGLPDILVFIRDHLTG
jgi:hypothetical protein